LIGQIVFGFYSNFLLDCPNVFPFFVQTSCLISQMFFAFLFSAISSEDRGEKSGGGARKAKIGHRISQSFPLVDRMET
jgi:hypothetical protein